MEDFATNPLFEKLADIARVNCVKKKNRNWKITKVFICTLLKLTSLPNLLLQAYAAAESKLAMNHEP